MQVNASAANYFYPAKNCGATLVKTRRHLEKRLRVIRLLIPAPSAPPTFFLFLRGRNRDARNVVLLHLLVERGEFVVLNVFPLG